MRKNYLIVVLVIQTSLLFSQEKRIFQHAVSFNYMSLFNQTLSLAYNYRINETFELTLNPKVHFHSNGDNKTLFGTSLSDDPYWYYDSYTLTTGARINIGGLPYFEPDLFFRHAWFSDRTLIMENEENHKYNGLGTFNRKYTAIGGLIKFGLNFHDDRFRYNPFVGFGFNYRFYKELLLDKKIDAIPIAGNYPIKSTYGEAVLIIQFGVEIGFKFHAIKEHDEQMKL